MEKETQLTTGFPWDQVLLKMLDWPFLLFSTAAIFFCIYRGQIRALIGKPSIKISWGDRSIELTELGDKLDQDIDPIREKLELLEEQVALLVKGKSDDVVSAPEEPTAEDVKKVINGPLQNKRYRYRTAAGVAREAKISRAKAQTILSSNPDIKVVKARNGGELYTVFHNPKTKT